MNAAGSPGIAAPDAVTLLRKTSDEEHRVREGAWGAQVEVWRRVATIDVPAAALVALAGASAAHTAQLALPLDASWVDDDTLPFLAASGGGR